MTKEKLTQLEKLGVKIDLAALRSVLYGNTVRQAIGEFMFALGHDAYVLSGDEFLLHPGVLRSQLDSRIAFPNVIVLLADARTSEVATIDAIVDRYDIEQNFTIAEMVGQIMNNSLSASMPVLTFGDGIQLFQYMNGKGVSYVPRIYQRRIGLRGENEFYIMRPVNLQCESGDIDSALSLSDILKVYGLTDAEAMKTSESVLNVKADALIQEWISAFEERFRKMTSIQRMVVQKGRYSNNYSEFDTRLEEMLNEILVDTYCSEIFSLVTSVYEGRAGAAGRNSEKEVEPAASGTSSSLELEDVQAVLCTLESVDHTDSIPALNRPRYIGWFKTIQDAVDFVTYELDNSPMYKNVESVEKKILENGDIEVTINSVVKLVYHFELIQK